MRAPQACVAGVGHTALAARLDRPAWALQAEAVRAAVRDAGLAPGDVDGLITEAGYSQGVIEGITPHFLRLGAMLGLDPRYTATEVLGGASSVAMVQRAALAVEAGLCRACVCVFGDAPSQARGTWSYGRGDEAAFGLFGAIGLHALAARRHMAVHGTRAEQLGEVAVTFRRHAGLTPHAQQRTPLTLDGYLGSPFIVEPLRVADCCLVSDAAGAVVVTSAERARDLRPPAVRIVGFGQAHHLTGLAGDDYLTALPARESGRVAFGMAGLGPADVDVAQLYDCFTSVVIVQLEDYGFCAKGEGGAFVEGGRLGLEGALPANTAGGLLAEGFGGGMLHVVEAVRQLRGEAGTRQVAEARVALVSGHGLGMNTHATLLLARD